MFGGVLLPPIALFSVEIFNSNRFFFSIISLHNNEYIPFGPTCVAGIQGQASSSAAVFFHTAVVHNLAGIHKVLHHLY